MTESHYQNNINPKIGGGKKEKIVEVYKLIYFPKVTKEKLSNQA